MGCKSPTLHCKCWCRDTAHQSDIIAKQTSSQDHDLGLTELVHIPFINKPAECAEWRTIWPHHETWPHDRDWGLQILSTDHQVSSATMLRFSKASNWCGSHCKRILLVLAECELGPNAALLLGKSFWKLTQQSMCSTHWCKPASLSWPWHVAPILVLWGLQNNNHSIIQIIITVMQKTTVNEINIVIFYWWV